MNPLSLAILCLPRPLTEEDAEWLNAQLEARLAQHLEDRAKYLGASVIAGAGTGAEAGSPLSTKPALSMAPAIVAWDLTLRCPVCNSNVDGSRNDYYCPQCAKGGNK